MYIDTLFLFLFFLLLLFLFLFLFLLVLLVLLFFLFLLVLLVLLFFLFLFLLFLFLFLLVFLVLLVLLVLLLGKQGRHSVLGCDLWSIVDLLLSLGLIILILYHSSKSTNTYSFETIEEGLSVLFIASLNEGHGLIVHQPHLTVGHGQQSAIVGNNEHTTLEGAESFTQGINRLNIPIASRTRQRRTSGW